MGKHLILRGLFSNSVNAYQSSQRSGTGTNQGDLDMARRRQRGSGSAVAVGESQSDSLQSMQVLVAALSEQVQHIIPWT
jgi:hypothetical protein